MAERQQRQQLERLVVALRDQLTRFVFDVKTTGKQLGSGSYGSVEEVKKIQLEILACG